MKLPKLKVKFLGEEIELGGEMPKCYFCGTHVSGSTIFKDPDKPICWDCSQKWKRIKQKMKS